MSEEDTNMGGAEENTIDIEDEETTVPATQDDLELDPDADGDAEESESGGPVVNLQTVFLDYLRSPIVSLSLSVFGADEPVILSAHRAVLIQAPWFATRLSSDSTFSLDLPPEFDLDAIGCFLQYQYTGEYFPRRLAAQPDGLETDPLLPAIDNTGSQLLKHARVYTLAETLGLPDLQTLAHSKIHRINSTAVGEIAYARYVYGHTSRDDTMIRKPVAAFWATRSHVLRHEAEAEFRSMCLDFPQFGFDVLSLVLDAREKRTREREDVDGTPTTVPGKGRKRMRPSVNL